MNRASLLFPALFYRLFRCRILHRSRLMLQRGMSCRQACHWHTERGAGYIVVADHVTELYRVRVAAMFATDAHFQIWAGLAALCNGPLHQGAHAVSIDRLEGILQKN